MFFQAPGPIKDPPLHQSSCFLGLLLAVPGVQIFRAFDGLDECDFDDLDRQSLARYL